jgi:hypothetical protein
LSGIQTATGGPRSTSTAAFRTSSVSTGDSFQVSGDVSGIEYTGNVSFGGATVMKQSIGAAPTLLASMTSSASTVSTSVSGEDEIPTFLDSLHS